MTRQIEETLGLPSLESFMEDSTQEESLNALEAISGHLNISSGDLDDALIDPDGSRQHAKEMDEIHDAALTAHRDMIDMAFNMEPKNAGSIMEPAARMLEIALKASQNKTDAKMKSIKLKMEKEKHDHELKKNQEEGVIQGEISPRGQLMDRNELLKNLKQNK